jgi:DNA mismatch endonuclease (patch repair protein)
MDDRTPEQRSKTMAAVQSQNTKLEHSFLNEFSRTKLRGIERYPTDILGKPDLAHRRSKTVVFLDSCFWHGCPEHLRMPSSNRTYWIQKISRNRARDSLVNRELRDSGWLVMRIWEHSLKNPRTKKWWCTRLLNQIKVRTQFRATSSARS